MWCLALVFALNAHAPAAALPVSAPADSAPTAVSAEALRHYLYGRWLDVNDDAGGAMAEYDRAISLSPRTPGILLRASEAAARAGDTSRSLELAKQALAISPDEPRGLWLEGAALFNLERPGEALAPLVAACHGDSDEIEYWRTLAQVAETLDRVSIVEECWSHVTALDDEDGEAWFQLATAQARLGAFGAADSALDQALEFNPDRPGALFLRGLIRESTGDVRAAIDLYRQHLAVHSHDVATRRRLALLLAQQERFPEALEEARRLAQAAPGDAEALQLEADLAFDAKHADEAHRALVALGRLAPDDPGNALREVGVLVRHDRSREGLRLADEWAAGHGEGETTLEFQARAQAIAGRLDSAAVYARMAAAAEPDSAGPLRLLARVLQDAGRWGDATAAWRKLQVHEPEDTGVLLDMGFCLEQAGDVPAAIDAGRSALKLSPDLPSALNFLGYVLADHNQELEEAERLIRRALELEPDNGAFVDSFGWLLYRQGHLVEARTQLEKAVTLTGGDPVVREHLGDVYKDLRLTDLARQQYRASLAGDAHNSRVRGKLESLH